MALFQGHSDGNAHWSKDYIEHLRTIHFILVVLCTTGLLISKSPNIYSLETAQTELRQIRSFAQKPLPKWFEEFNHVPTPLVSVVWLEFTEGRVEYTAGVPLSAMTTETNLHLCPKQPTKETDNAEFGSDLSEKSSLERFEALWNHLNCSVEKTHLIFAISSQLLNTRTRRLNEIEFVPYRLVRYTDELLKVKLTKKKSRKFELELNNNFPQTLSGALDHLIYISQFDGNKDKHDEMPIVLFESEGTFLAAKGLTRVDERKPAHNLLVRAQSDWTCTLTFRECFPELVRTAKGKEKYSLKDLSDWLDEKVAHSQPRQLEIFNIKFPAEDQLRWGIFIILAVLTYLWLHLRELSPRLKANDPGRDVAWIGLYSSIPAMFLNWLSVAVLPFCTILLFGVLVVQYESPFGEVFTASNWPFLVVWIIIPCCFCGLLGFSTYRKILRLGRLVAASTEGPEQNVATSISAAQPK
jgi:hypothetical protein